MNLLMVTPMYASFHNGGLAYSCQRIARILSKKIEKVRVIVFDCGQQYHSNVMIPNDRTFIIGNDGIEIEFIPNGFSYTGAILPKKKSLVDELQQAYFLMRELVINFHPQCLISFFVIPYGYTCSLISKEFSIPFIAGVRGNDVGRFMHDPICIPLLNYIFRYANAIQVLSQDLKEKISFISPKTNRVEVVYNGIEPKYVINVINNQFPDPDTFTIGSVGIFKPKKGIEVLLRVFNRIKQPHWRLLLVGDFIKNNSTIDMFIQSVDCREQVCLTGIVGRDKALEYLAKMDVFVAPTLSDGCPNATLEAMVAEKPIIATRISAMADILVDGESGFLLDYPDENKISAALEKLDKDKDLRRYLGKKALHEVTKLYPPYEEEAWCKLISSICNIKI